MLIIKTSLKEFKGKGIGLVCEEFVKKGQIIWKYDSRVDFFFDKKDIPKRMKDFFDKYAVDGREGRLFCCLDNTRFMNHSKTPNVRSLGKGSEIAKDGITIRNIKPGEEITIDYEELEDIPINFKVIR